MNQREKRIKEREIEFSVMQKKTEEFPKLIKKEIEVIHTYEVPEIIMVPLLDANDFYLEWIEKETL